jgi:probable F420-dependent oxidoreductase
VLEQLGYATIWPAGPSISGFEQVREVVAATRTVPIASGIISVDRFDAADVAAGYAQIEQTYPGRFVVGLGGAHGPKPLRMLSSYLDALDAGSPPCPRPHASWRRWGLACSNWPVSARPVRTPCWSPPDYTARARARALLGEEAVLVVGQLVIVDPDPVHARALARSSLRPMTARPGSGYSANLRRMDSPRRRSHNCPTGWSTPWSPGAIRTLSPRGSWSICAPGPTRSR